MLRRLSVNIASGKKPQFKKVIKKKTGKSNFSIAQASVGSKDSEFKTEKKWKEDQTHFSAQEEDTGPKIIEEDTGPKITEEDAHDELMAPPRICRFISEDINLEGLDLLDGPPPVNRVFSGPIHLKGISEPDPHHASPDPHHHTLDAPPPVTRVDSEDLGDLIGE